jgi:hypothetical protein
MIRKQPKADKSKDSPKPSDKKAAPKTTKKAPQGKKPKTAPKRALKAKAAPAVILKASEGIAVAPVKRDPWRPTKYDPSYCAKVIEWGRDGKSRTWIASEIDVTRETLNEWAKAHPAFSDALTRAKLHEQRWWEEKGTEGMTSNLFNGGVWSKHMSCRFPDEWRENSKVTLAGDQENPVQVQHAVSWMTEEEAKARGWA